MRQAEELKRPATRKDDGDATAAAAKGGRYQMLEEGLSRHAGTKVRIAGNKRGRIELHFHNEDELTRLLELLGFQA